MRERKTNHYRSNWNVKKFPRNKCTTAASGSRTLVVAIWKRALYCKWPSLLHFFSHVPSYMGLNSAGAFVRSTCARANALIRLFIDCSCDHSHLSKVGDEIPGPARRRSIFPQRAFINGKGLETRLSSCRLTIL